MRMPIPKVDRADIERIVRRDFPAEMVPRIYKILGEYGGESYHRGIERVQMATLKLADGKEDALRSAMDAAKIDYRDVLAAAEYRRYCNNWNSHLLSKEEQERLIAEDWQEYTDWLNR